MVAIETPVLAPAVRRTLLDAISVSDAAHPYLTRNALSYEPAIVGGTNKDVPVEGALLAPPVLVKGTTNASGGTFGAGTFYWKITAVTGYGETTGSNEISATLVATGTQAMSWAAVSGAQLYRIYRGTAAGAENTLVGTTAALAFTDTGAAGAALAIPTVSTAGNTPPGVKTFDARPSDVTTKVFTAYRGLNDALLRTSGTGSPELETLFEAGEAIYVEDKIQTQLLSPAAVDITPTPGTPVTNLNAALGLLEQWISSRYLFKPLISGNLLAVELVQAGRETLTETVHGTPIASAAGFGTDGPGSAVSTATTAWLYISGQITLWKGPAEVNTGVDLYKNRDYSLVEKSYAATIDGPVAAILVGF